jgi:hypothetical protein
LGFGIRDKGFIGFVLGFVLDLGLERMENGLVMEILNGVSLDKLMNTYSNLSKYEMFIAGYCSAITSVSAEIILNFISTITIIEDQISKEIIYSDLLTGQLGKAKLMLSELQQKSLPLKTSKSCKTHKNICNICGTHATNKEIDYLECYHPFHNQCLENYIHNEIKKKTYPIKCPACDIEVTSDYIERKIGGNDYCEYVTNEISHAIGYIECPIEDCKHIISFNIETHQFKVQCGKCLNFFCFNCGVKFHENLTCNEYLSLRNHKCSYCGLPPKQVNKVGSCVCSNVVCGKCDYPTNICKCGIRRL